MEEEGGFEDTVLEEEVHRIVAQEIEKLPEEQRKVVYFHMEGKNNLEIAEIMQISVNTVKTHKARARKTLKNKLKTFWKDFREVIANLICIPFLLTTIVVVMLTVGVYKLTDTILQIDRDVIKIFEECIYGAEEEIGKSKECNS